MHCQSESISGSQGQLITGELRITAGEHRPGIIHRRSEDNLRYGGSQRMGIYSCGYSLADLRNRRELTGLLSTDTSLKSGALELHLRGAGSNIYVDPLAGQGVHKIGQQPCWDCDSPLLFDLSPDPAANSDLKIGGCQFET